MKKKVDKTVRTEKKEKEFGYSTTVKTIRKPNFEEISTQHHAFLEIIGAFENEKRVELGEDEFFIGRSPECQIKLSTENVSRKHARITFHNEEYQIEDLGSLNGVYINGIKVEKCTLRNQDQIEIGDVKILFNEGNIPE